MSVDPFDIASLALSPEFLEAAHAKYLLEHPPINPRVKRLANYLRKITCQRCGSEVYPTGFPDELGREKELQDIAKNLLEQNGSVEQAIRSAARVCWNC
jgi:hypothetical protein